VLLAVAPLAVIAMPWNLPMWWMVRSLRLAIELDCDRRVLARGISAESYGRVLIDVAGQRQPALSLALAARRSKLAHRLVSLSVQGSALRAWSWAAVAPLFLVLAVDTVPASRPTGIAAPHPPELAWLDPAAVYTVDGVPASYERVRALDPAQIRSIEVVARRVVSGEPAQHVNDRVVRVTTQNGPSWPTPPPALAFEGIGGPNPLIRLHDSVTLPASEVRLVLNGRDIDVGRLSIVDPADIHAVKVIRLGASARTEVHLTTRQRI
jgi:hypothetical protein